MLRKFWNKYKANFKKDILIHILVIIGMLGILCILLSSCLESSQEEPKAQESENAELISQESYRLQLQEQLAEMLSNITGVGKVEVLVTIQGSEAYHYAQEADSRYVTIGGSQKEALVESISLPAITGVVVACEGGGKSTVQETVYQAVSVACGLRTAQIYVTQLEQTTIRKES
ncbi:MAG: hypothetical protein K2G88_03695 [Oscillospiraceae bacterium]|nr:hypothetical protein [Oscillospiraceae bacterium]